MKVTKQQKILGGVVLLGAMALGTDRLFLLKDAPDDSGPATSEYAIMKPAAATSTTPRVAAATVSVAERLRKAGKVHADNAEPFHDAFALGPAWIAAPSREDHTAAREEQFRQAHRLTAVTSAGGKAHAVVDGQFIPVGESLDGFKLVSISHRSATFESEKARVILNMNERAGAMAGARD